MIFKKKKIFQSVKLVEKFCYSASDLVSVMVKTLQNEPAAITTREMHELVRNNVVTEEESS